MSAPGHNAGIDSLLGAIDDRAITRADLEAAGALIADAVACMAGAKGVDAAQPVLRWARRQPSSAQSSAMVLGALSNVLEMDAMHVASSVHPGTVVVPAALAVAIAVEASGPELARAVLRGTEAAIRLGRSTGVAHRQRYQSTSTCGGVGAALACADLLGLTREQAIDAMSNVASTAGGLWAFLEEDTLTKQWHAGRAAESAVTAAQLAAEGLRGARRVLDGKRGFLAVLCEGGYAAEWGMRRERWQIHEIAYKPWPSPRPTHAAITSALNARPRIGDAEIDRVVLRTYAFAVELCNRKSLSSAHDARFSLAYCAAAALADGNVGFDSFEPATIARHAALASRIVVEENASMTADYPRLSRASLEITLANGETVQEEVEHALGDPEFPLTVGQHFEKLHALLGLAGLADDAGLQRNIQSIADSPGSPARLLNQALASADLAFVPDRLRPVHINDKETA